MRNQNKRSNENQYNKERGNHKEIASCQPRRKDHLTGTNKSSSANDANEEED